MTKPTFLQAVRFAASGLCALVTLGSCSLVLEFPECRTDSDCANAAGEAMICNVSTELCEVQPAPDEVVCEERDTCEAIFGDDAICGTQGRCALLTSDECTQVFLPDGAEPDEVVWIGSVLATSPPFTEAVVPIENAIELAVEDFNTFTSLADGRKVGWIACDSQGDPALAIEAATHLIENVGVPAIIGPTTSDEVFALRDTVVNTGTFLISPTASAAAIANLDDNGLIWRTIGSDTVQSRAIAERVPLLEDPEAASILVLAVDNEYGRGLFDPMLARLAEVAPGTATGALLYPDVLGLSDEDIVRAYATVIADGFPQNADTVIFLGAGEVRNMLEAFLLAWDGSGMTQLPRFIVSHGAVPIMQPSLGLVAENFRPVLMNSLQGVSPTIQDSENFESFNIRYRVVFSDLNPVSASPLGYDAAALTLLALSASAQPRGVDLAGSMVRLADPSGTPHALGDDQAIAVGRDLLVQGQSLNIGGVSGPLDFDLVTGELLSNYVGWDVVPVAPGSPDGVLQATRLYTLDENGIGTWSDAPQDE